MQQQTMQGTVCDSRKAIDNALPARPWNTKQAAAFLGMSRRHAYELARAGVLPAKKQGRRWYFSPAKLHEWVGM